MLLSFLESIDLGGSSVSSAESSKQQPLFTTNYCRREILNWLSIWWFEYLGVKYLVVEYIWWFEYLVVEYLVVEYTWWLSIPGGWVSGGWVSGGWVYLVVDYLVVEYPVVWVSGGLSIWWLSIWWLSIWLLSISGGWVSAGWVSMMVYELRRQLTVEWLKGWSMSFKGFGREGGVSLRIGFAKRRKKMLRTKFWTVSWRWM